MKRTAHTKNKRVVGNTSMVKNHRLVTSTILLGSMVICLGLKVFTPADVLLTPCPEKGCSFEIVTPVQASMKTAEIKPTQKQQILSYIVEKFGDRANDAIAMVSQCENHAFNPLAVNHNSNGTIDRGVFQINSVHGGDELFDWHKNIDMAYKIYHEQGNTFHAWTCSAPVLHETNYLGNTH